MEHQIFKVFRKCSWDKKLTGFVAAVPTPMQPDGSLHLAQIDAIVDHLLQNGISAIYAVGSTGEGPSLSTTERQAVAAGYVAAARNRLPVVVQVGHNSLAEAHALARHAQKIGAAAVSATSPSYFKPASVEALVGCMAQVAAGAPDLPFYYYHIPSLVGLQVDLPTFLSRAADGIPNFRGVKYTAPTIWEYQACLRLDGGRFDCLFGLDEMLLPALSVGARGAIGSTYNFAAPIYLRVLKAFNCGELSTAQQAQAEAVAMVQVLLRHGGIGAIKAVMKLIGFDCGPVRLPLTSLSEVELASLQRELETSGFFEAISIR